MYVACSCNYGALAPCGVTPGLRPVNIGHRGYADRRPRDPGRHRDPVRDRAAHGRALSDAVRARRARARASSRACRASSLEPDLVLLVFLPPLLFTRRGRDADPRAAGQPRPRSLRLSIGLVLFTMVIVAVVAQAAVPASRLGGRVRARSDRRADRRPRRDDRLPPARRPARSSSTLVEGEALFNDATALVAYRAAVLAVVSGTFVLSEALAEFAVAAVGGVAIGVAGRPGRRRAPAPARRPAGRGRSSRS